MPDEVDVNAGAARVHDILHGDKPEPTPLLNAIGPIRKTRSDAGTKREKKAVVMPENYALWIMIPGLHCEVASEVGRRALSDHIASGATEFSGVGWDIIEQLLSEIDRLRK